MNANRLGRRCLVTLALGTVAPLVLAQVLPGGGMHERGEARNNPRFQQCRKQADEKRLPNFPERRSFMEQCLKDAGNATDDAKGTDSRENVREGQNGHLHSDPPPAQPPAPAPAPSGS